MAALARARLTVTKPRASLDAGRGPTHHWAWKMPKNVVPRQSWPARVKTALRLLKETWRSGRRHSSRVFWKVVHFFCRVLVPPRSP